MATESQTTANQLNAQKCTGPTTAEGKATSSQNAFKTGLYAKSDTLARAQRCITASQRSFAHALKQLQTIQTERAKRAAEPASDPAPGPSSDPSSVNATEPSTPKLVSFRQPTGSPAETAPTHPKTEDSPPIAA